MLFKVFPGFGNALISSYMTGRKVILFAHSKCRKQTTPVNDEIPLQTLVARTYIMTENFIEFQMSAHCEQLNSRTA